MATRGVYGFRINEQDKVTYNHCDSYPDWLGRHIMEYIASSRLAEMKQAARSIVLIDENSQPSAELIEFYKKYADLEVSNQRYEDWYCLLRKTQGDLSVYNADVRHMIDSRNLLGDSLFCEWAYIINLDNGTLETYRGRSKDKTAHGRYARLCSHDDNGYVGVALINETPLINIRKDSIDSLVEYLELLGSDGRPGF